MPPRTTVRLTDRELLRRTMQVRGETVRSLAEAAGVSKSMIQHLRDGRLSSASRDLADRLENVLGVPGLLFVPAVSTSGGRSSTTDGAAA